MDRIIKRYRGRTTSQGHKLEVTREASEMVIAFNHVGEYGDEYDPHVRVAAIEELGDAFRVHFYHQDAEEPTATGDYATEKDLFVALDHAVEERSQELGAIEK
jgi:hypothetical protein